MSGIFSVRLSEEGLFLEFTMSWPDLFIDLNQIHCRYLTSEDKDRNEMYHPNLIDFRNIFEGV